ncbi:MAG: sulfite exporter TauE/SafE family protein [Desulfatitalea sp.]|nr:sulfite exporter TauE/SafE family protein [Desulfatitalea sp.]
MPLDSWLAFPIGIVIASVSSTVGIGGGILWMPFLMIALNLSPGTAVVTSLTIQTVGMGSGTFAFWRKRRIDVHLALLLLLFTVPGIAMGAWLTKTMSPPHIRLALGVLTLLTALVFVSLHQQYGDSGIERADTKKAFRYSWMVSCMGVASGMLSVSIGEWIVPLMRQKLSLRMGVAVATSIATIFGTCLLGVTFHLVMGAQVNAAALLWAIPGVVIGGQVGPRVVERVNDRTLKEIFIFLLTLIGIHLIYNSY